MAGLFLYEPTLLFVYGFVMVVSVMLTNWEYRSISWLKSLQITLINRRKKESNERINLKERGGKTVERKNIMMKRKEESIEIYIKRGKKSERLSSVINLFFILPS